MPTAPPDDDLEAHRLKAAAKRKLFGQRNDVRIGRFVVLKRLGEGGMGIVYAAYDAELDRQLAIKLIRADLVEDLEPDEAAARLLREAQALAKVSHPNVIQIYEVGMHDEQVYVAMELVEGQTLAAWMGEGRHPARAVLDHFIPAGRGLAAAHAVGLVHRDFKPANVLVGSDGRVRVLDFGLARRVEEPPPDASSNASLDALSSELTVDGSRPGTPSYMAPEQHLGGNVDARSDQFAFCVALYEALYGERPFGGKNRTALALAVTRGEIRDAPRGSGVPEWLRRVVLRGLRQDPDARWPSMQALLDQLTRDRGARRRRVWGTAVVVGAVLSSIAAGVYATRNEVQVCEGGQAKLVDVWDAGRKAQVRAAFEATGVPMASTTWTRVESSLDGYVESWLAQYQQACEASQAGEQSGEMLDLRMRCLDERLEELEARVDVLTDADETVVERAAASVAQLPPVAGCADATALLARLKPPTDPAVEAEVDALRAELTRAGAMLEAGRYQPALELASAASRRARSVDYPPVRAEALLMRGRLERELARGEDARVTLAEAYWTGLEAGHDEAAVGAASQMIGVLVELARPEPAEEWVRHAGAVTGRTRVGPMLEAELLDGHADLLVHQARYDQAREQLERSLELKRAAAGEQSPIVADSLHRQARVAFAQGQYADAREDWERALEIRSATLGEEHPAVAAAHVGIGVTFSREERYDEAVDRYERAIVIQERAFGSDHLTTARYLNNLGIVLRKQGKFEPARETQERALSLYEKFLGPEHPKVADSLANLANVYEDLDDLESARTSQERALRIRKSTLEKGHPDLADSFDSLAELDEKAGRLESAREQYALALEIREQAFEADHPMIPWTLTRLARAERRLGDEERARSLLERALSLYGPSSTKGDVASTRFELARVLWPRDRRRALELAELAERDFEAAGDAHADELDALRSWRAPLR